MTANVPLLDSFETLTRMREERAVAAATRARVHRLRQEVELEVRRAFLEADAAAQSVADSASLLDVRPR